MTTTSIDSRHAAFPQSLYVLTDQAIRSFSSPYDLLLGIRFLMSINHKYNKDEFFIRPFLGAVYSPKVLALGLVIVDE